MSNGIMSLSLSANLPFLFGGNAFVAFSITHCFASGVLIKSDMISSSSFLRSIAISFFVLLIKAMSNSVPTSSICIVTVLYSGITSSIKKKSHNSCSFNIGRKYVISRNVKSVSAAAQFPNKVISALQISQFSFEVLPPFFLMFSFIKSCSSLASFSTFNPSSCCSSIAIAFKPKGPSSTIV